MENDIAKFPIYFLAGITTVYVLRSGSATRVAKMTVVSMLTLGCVGLYTGFWAIPSLIIVFLALVYAVSLTYQDEQHLHEGIIRELCSKEGDE